MTSEKLLGNKSLVDAHQVVILDEWILVEGGESRNGVWIAIKLFKEVMIAKYLQAF